MAKIQQDIDFGYKRIKAFYTRQPPVESRVGIQGPEANQQGERNPGPTNAELAAIHEFGIGVPQRSFLRSTFDEERKKYLRVMRKGFRSVVDGKRKLASVFLEVGETYRKDVIKKIKSRIPPPTKIRQGRDEKGQFAKKDPPLIDTGTMVGSISTIVKTRGRNIFKEVTGKV